MWLSVAQQSIHVHLYVHVHVIPCTCTCILHAEHLLYNIDFARGGGEGGNCRGGGGGMHIHVHVYYKEEQLKSQIFWGRSIPRGIKAPLKLTLCGTYLAGIRERLIVV